MKDSSGINGKFYLFCLSSHTASSRIGLKRLKIAVELEKSGNFSDNCSLVRFNDAFNSNGLFKCLLSNLSL